MPAWLPICKSRHLAHPSRFQQEMPEQKKQWVKRMVFLNIYKVGKGLGSIVLEARKVGLQYTGCFCEPSSCRDAHHCNHLCAHHRTVMVLAPPSLIVLVFEFCGNLWNFKTNPYSCFHTPSHCSTIQRQTRIRNNNLQVSHRQELDVVNVGNEPSLVLTLPRPADGFCDKSWVSHKCRLPGKCFEKHENAFL